MASLKLGSHCVSTNFVYPALTFSLLQHYVTTAMFWKRHTRHFHAAGSGSYNTVLASYRHVLKHAEYNTKTIGTSTLSKKLFI